MPWMRSTGLTGVAALALSVVSLVGCKDSPAVATVRWQLEEQIPGAEFEKEFHLRLGRLTLGVSRRLAGWMLADDEELARLMKSVKRIDIGTYRVVSLPPLEEIEVPARLMDGFDRAGWSLVVGLRDEEERIWMFMRQDEDGGIRNIYIVALDEVELTMVSLEGRLGELLAEAIAADPGGFAASMAS